MEDWMKALLTSSVTLAIVALIGKMLGWKFSPKEKADVQKTESAIRIDVATIHSKKVEDEIKVSQQALEWTAQFAAQLEKANAVIDKLQAVIDKMRIDHAHAIDELEIALNKERRHCNEIKIELEKIKKLYGTND